MIQLLTGTYDILPVFFVSLVFSMLSGSRLRIKQPILLSFLLLVLLQNVEFYKFNIHTQPLSSYLIVKKKSKSISKGIDRKKGEKTSSGRSPPGQVQAYSATPGRPH